MYVIKQTPPVPTPIPGVAHVTWAGSNEALDELSVWRQSLAPGGATPPHSHDCDEVVLCLAGQGEIHVAGEAYPFGPHTTVVLPKNQVHQIFNTGPRPLETIGVFGASPVSVFLPDATRLDVPWRT